MCNLYVTPIAMLRLEMRLNEYEIPDPRMLYVMAKFRWQLGLFKENLQTQQSIFLGCVCEGVARGD